MTTPERDALLRRYIEGNLGKGEEEELFIRVALDQELRNDLLALQTVERAMIKDRAIDPAEFARLRDGVAAMLAGSVPESARRPAGSTAAHPSWWLAATATVALLLLLTFFIEQIGDAPHAAKTPAPVPQVIGSLSIRSESSHLASPAVVDDGDASAPLEVSSAPPSAARLQRPTMPRHRGPNSPNGITQRSDVRPSDSGSSRPPLVPRLLPQPDELPRTVAVEVTVEEMEEGATPPSQPR